MKLDYDSSFRFLVLLTALGFSVASREGEHSHLRRGRDLGKKGGCPRSKPAFGSSCDALGLRCEYDFVYFPTQEYDPVSDETICTLPYTSCAPTGGCVCSDLGGNPQWVCFSGVTSECSNKGGLFENPAPQYSFEPCNPNKKKFPSV